MSMDDLDAPALAMSETAKKLSTDGRPACRCAGNASFAPRRTVPTRETTRAGERLDDVPLSRVADLGVREPTLAHERGVFFIDAPFRRHPAVLVRIPGLARIDREELYEFAAESWLARARKRAAGTWLAEHGIACA